MSDTVTPVLVSFETILYGEDFWNGTEPPDGPPEAGAIPWLMELCADARFEVSLYSMYNTPESAAYLMRWLRHNGVDPRVLDFQIVTGIQLAVLVGGSLIITDRTVGFTGLRPEIRDIAKWAPAKMRVRKARAVAPDYSFSTVEDPIATHGDEHICNGCAHEPVCSVAAGVKKNQFEDQLVTISRCAAFVPERR